MRQPTVAGSTIVFSWCGREIRYVTKSNFVEENFSVNDNLQ